MKTNYMDLLKDPRWQRKRLEILNRDGFRCRSCTDDLKTLHVHHLKYDTDLLPWEYDDEDLVTLCETCHEVITALEKMLRYASFGMETVICVARLLNNIEIASIDKFIASQKEKING